MNIKGMLGKTFPCGCGRTHHIPTRHVECGPRAMDTLAPFMNAAGVSGECLVFADDNTWGAGGGLTMAALRDVRRLRVSRAILGERGRTLHCDERNLLALEAEAAGRDTLLCVGSGSLNDLGKAAAKRLGTKNYICVASAASMDGYTSPVSAILRNGVKETLEARAPDAVVADTRILSTAPERMTLAGIGDALGKYTSNADWLLSHMLLGESYCGAAWEVLKPDLDRLSGLMRGPAAAKDDKFLASLAETLANSGLCMSLAGNSRPASGSEHLFSHVLEMTALAAGEEAAPHGLQVFLGAWLAGRAYKRLLSTRPLPFPPKTDGASELERMTADWAAHGITLDGVPARKVEARKKSAEVINDFNNRFVEISEAISKRLPPDDMWPADFHDGPEGMSKFLGVSKERLGFALRHANQIRDRHTVFDLLYNCGLWEEFASGEGL